MTLWDWLDRKLTPDDQLAAAEHAQVKRDLACVALGGATRYSTSQLPGESYTECWSRIRRDLDIANNRTAPVVGKRNRREWQVQGSAVEDVAPRGTWVSCTQEVAQTVPSGDNIVRWRWTVGIDDTAPGVWHRGMPQSLQHHPDAVFEFGPRLHEHVEAAMHASSKRIDDHVDSALRGWYATPVGAALRSELWESAKVFTDQQDVVTTVTEYQTIGSTGPWFHTTATKARWAAAHGFPVRQRTTVTITGEWKTVDGDVPQQG